MLPTVSKAAGNVNRVIEILLQFIGIEHEVTSYISHSSVIILSVEIGYFIILKTLTPGERNVLSLYIVYNIVYIYIYGDAISVGIPAL